MAAAAASLLAASGATTRLDTGWRFSWAKSSIPLQDAVASMTIDGKRPFEVEYDDSSWEKVSLPHPVNAHDTFDNHATDPGEANFKRGMMFYRRTFEVAADSEDRLPAKTFLTFETVRQTIYVWVNGKEAGYYEAGIAPTAYDITSLVKSGANQLTVASDNTAMRGSKLFAKETIPGHEPGDMSGQPWQWNTTDFNEVQGGLVGSVGLVVKRHHAYLTLPYYNNLKTTGTYITAGAFDFVKGECTIAVDAEVRNEANRAQNLRVAFKVKDPATGEIVAEGSSDVANVGVAKDAGVVFKTALEADVYEKNPQPTSVKTPEVRHLNASAAAKGVKFWSPERPYLYDVETTLFADGKPIDRETVRTGFRKTEYDFAKGGLKINGKNIWLRGYAQRSTDEWAAIGVPPDWLQDYDAALLRKSNANFVRWMHVAPKPAPVRAFDKFGIVNVCPAGDKEGDTSGRNWAQRAEAMRDVMIYFRNSPSIVFWEAGNNQISAEHMKEMRLLKERLDPDGWRFMGCRTINTREQITEAEYAGTMLNRHAEKAFASMAAENRYMPIVETEYARQESPRRSWDDYTPPFYDYPGKYLRGGKKETGFDVYDQTQEDFACTTAKEYAEYFGARTDANGQKLYAACAALCWTDSNQHGRNSFSENCRSSGRVDAVRIPKENFDVFRTIQSDEPAVMLVGHWSYEPLNDGTYWFDEKEYNGKYMEATGKKSQRDPKHKTVYAIASAHVASVELVVNGKTVGQCNKPDGMFVYHFPNVDITENGVAAVVARDAEGRKIARHEVRTVEAKTHIKVKTTTSPAGFIADGSDIAMVDFTLQDKAGTVHPWAAHKITFTLTGDAKFMGGWNSGTFDETSPVGKNFVNLECGRARVFVKAGFEPSKIALKWECENGEKGIVNLETVAARGAKAVFPPNKYTFAAKTDARIVQQGNGAASGPVRYEVFVNGKKVDFHKGFGAPVKPDDTTGVVCAFAPVLRAIKEAGGELEFTEQTKGRPPKHLRDFSIPIVTLKTGGKTIEAACGETALVIDGGRDKNLTNCEMYKTHPTKAQILAGELVSLVGYIPGVKVSTDTLSRRVDITVGE